MRHLRLSRVEDLGLGLVPVPVQDEQGRRYEEETLPREGYRIKSCPPRIEGLFARIKRWTRQSDKDTYWCQSRRTISLASALRRMRATSPIRRIPTRILSRLISKSPDDRGNVILDSYLGEEIG
jgi:hypothetical protein